jgi:hypothetical protein
MSVRFSMEDIHKWSMSTWKDAQWHCALGQCTSRPQ